MVNKRESMIAEAMAATSITGSRRISQTVHLCLTAEGKKKYKLHLVKAHGPGFYAASTVYDLEDIKLVDEMSVSDLQGPTARGCLTAMRLHVVLQSWGRRALASIWNLTGTASVNVDGLGCGKNV